MDLPTGTITLAFTDIQDSSEMSERYRADFEPLRAAHFRLLREAMTRWNGQEVSTAGDALFLVFGNAADAVQWAVDTQRTLARHDWPLLISPDGRQARAEIRIRIGMHTGEPFLSREGPRIDYFGPVVNRAARVSSAGYGGQVLLSDATHSLVQYDLPAEIAFRDCGLHRLKGVGEDRLWQVQTLDLDQTFPPLKTLDPQRHNLPASATPYLGADEKVREWLEKLRAPSTRVLTLTGFGGMGKTRTALHLAELSIEDYADGVWWVAAEEARTRDEMIQKVADALRLPLQPDMPIQEQVARHLRERTLLLVLDNLEQVADAGRGVKDLLARAPNIKFLITSRRAMDIQAERVIELMPLSDSEAAQLFVARVRDRQPEFELNTENAADIGELCSRLDGVPLALELAASRIAMMTPRQMVHRLNELFKLLQTRSPDLPERQRALRAAVDWSYDLLTDDDRTVFAQLSVFAGGFTLEDAEAVCEAFDVLESIAELRRQSLLRTETDAESQETRFSMLNSLHEYAREKLAAAGGVQEIQLRHARYFQQFGLNRLSMERTAREMDALRELEVNSANLRAALDYAANARDTELLARLGLTVGTAWGRRGYQAEALTYIRAALDAVKSLGETHKALLAELLSEQAWLSVELHIEGAAAIALEARALFAEQNDTVGVARTELILGYAAMLDRDYQKARDHFDHALAGLIVPAVDVYRANVHNTYGLLECTDPSGSDQKASEHIEEALRLRRRLGDVRGLAETLTNSGILAYRQEDWRRAWRCYEEALTHEQELNNWLGVARSLYNMAEVAQATGQSDAGLKLAAASERLMDLVKSPWVQSVAALVESIGMGDIQRVGAVRSEALLQPRETLAAWALAAPNTDS